MSYEEYQQSMNNLQGGGGNPEDAVRYGREQFDRFLSNLPEDVQKLVKMGKMELYPFAYYATHEIKTGDATVELFRETDTGGDYGYCNFHNAKFPAGTYNLITHIHVSYSEATGTTGQKGNFVITSVKNELLQADLKLDVAGKEVFSLGMAELLTSDQDETTRSGQVLRIALPTPKWGYEHQIVKGEIKMFAGMPTPTVGKIHLIKGTVKGIGLRTKV